jgi:ATP-dependent helicase HepA
MGRIVDADSLEHFEWPGYAVRFPNQDESAEHTEDRLEVRALARHADPAEILALGGAETQFFFDRRYRLLRCLVEMRAVVHGMTGLLAAKVELVSHQVEVVRRVLTDPVPRYLLADEVGMGKTIEAGLILRQLLHDNPGQAALVIAPQALCQQWRDELDQRFDLTEQQVAVVPYEELAPELVAPALLVVDEVHRVLSATNERHDEQVETLELIANTSRVLLLLSATPVLGHEATFLRMLHLLDAEHYHPDDLPAFTNKVHRRQEYGRFLLGLNADMPPAFLEESAREALQLFPDDPTVSRLALDLISAVAAGRLAELETAQDALRTHVAETYRIHHRLIRNRRAHCAQYEFSPRDAELLGGPERVVVMDHPDPRYAEVVGILEQWRAAALAVLDEHPDTDLFRAACADRLLELVEAGGVGLAALQTTTRQHLVGDGATALFSSEPEILEQIGGLGADGEGDGLRFYCDALGQLRDELQGHRALQPVKIVAFSSASEFVERLGIVAMGRFGRSAVRLIRENFSRQKVAHAMAEFQHNRNSWLLLCDPVGEEGLNLQFASALVHLDLPLSPVRVEQRIGRLDRVLRPVPVLIQRVLLPAEMSGNPWRAWYALLRDGFGVFDRSISDAQFLLETMRPRIAQRFFEHGTQGLIGLCDEIRSELESERQRLDEQFVLDEFRADDAMAKALYDGLEEFEGTVDVEEESEDWLVTALQLRKHHRGHGGRSFSYHWHRGTLIPAMPWKRLLADGLERPLTYDRTEALADTHLGLLRDGHPFFTALERYLDWEDRGTVYATWRHDPDWIGEPWMGFRLIFSVQAGFALPEQGVLESVPQMLRRRADHFLHPYLQEVFLDADLQEVVEPAKVGMLQRPYTRRSEVGAARDYNLGSRREAMAELLDEALFASRCHRASQQGMGLLRDSVEFQERRTDALRRAEIEQERRDARLRARADALQREGVPPDVDWLDSEQALDLQVLAALREPAVRLEAMGFVVIAAQPPPGGNEEV